jgi:hypothetical protein
MNSNNIKQGRGRPTGSNSFIRIRACDLIKMVGEMAVVPVSKVWLRENGLELVETQIKIATAAPAVENTEEKIQFSITNFED